jgi:hypothetical protein
MENKHFYIWDPDRKVFDSDPSMRDQTEWFVWDPHTWWEFNSAMTHGTEWFPRAEIYRGSKPPDPPKLGSRPRKKVAIVRYEFIKKVITNGRESEDAFKEDGPARISNINLNWADIVVTVSTEPMADWWPRVYGDICHSFHHDHIKCIFGSYQKYTTPPPDRFFVNCLSFFSYVVSANDVRDINQKTVPFRKYMFDVLLGTVKTSRSYVMYRLLESEFIDQCLINLQPNPHNWPNFIEQLDPKGFERHGLISRYTSPELYDLEEPVVQQFKTDTKDADLWSQYSANSIPRPDHNQPGNMTLMSCVVPWGIYQSSWYSIVAESTDFYDSSAFLTEKTAKCLFAKRIFIMFNTPFLLKRLRDLGFRTFHGDIIDESYDNEVDLKKRCEMAWEQVRRLYNTENPRAVYEHFQDILEHNHQHILNLSKQQLVDIQQFIHAPFALEQTKM